MVTAKNLQRVGTDRSYIIHDGCFDAVSYYTNS